MPTQPIPVQVVALLTLCALYTVWVYVGVLITGEYVYEQLDPNFAGTAAVASSIVHMWSLTVMMFLVQYGLHSLRQLLVRRMEDRASESGEWN